MTGKPRIVLPDTSSDTLAVLEAGGQMERLRSLGTVEIHLGRAPDPAVFAERVREANAVLLAWDFPTEAFEAAEHLEVISFAGVGASSYVDLDAARRHNVAVTTVPGYGDTSVAEHALALLLAVMRQLPAADAGMRSGGWDAGPAARQLSGSTVGLVGWGGTAQAFARLLQGFRVELLAWTRSRPAGALAGEVRFTSLDELFERSDAVSLHLALTPETTGLIDAPLLRRLGPEGFLVNTARGALVDEKALTEALRARRIAGAGLDVYAIEPLPANSELRTIPSTVLSPHTAYRTHEARQQLYANAVTNLERALARKG